MDKGCKFDFIKTEAMKMKKVMIVMILLVSSAQAMAWCANQND